MIEIDGSYGEGGGQIIRTALSLSCLLKKPFRIFNIRKKRKKPGLMPQHLTCVKAAQLITDAEVTGDYAGSSELLFSPREVKGGYFSFDIGTAGSTSLVFQTLIPALAFSQQKTTLTLKGGTHVPLSPSFHYLSNVFVHFLGQLGIKVELVIESYGFYPRGGGIVRAEIFPVKNIKPLRIMERGNILQITGYSAVGNLPLSIAERQKDAFVNKINREIKNNKACLIIELVEVPSIGQGTFVYLEARSEDSVAGFTALGARGKKAEVVGEEAAEEFVKYYSTGAALDYHIADQIVLYLSLCSEESRFTTSSITNHLLTNLWVINLFHGIQYSIEGEVGEKGMVKIKSKKNK